MPLDIFRDRESSRFAGSKTITGSLTIGGQILVGDGAIGAPAVSFSNAPTTGVYRNAINDMRFSLAGADLMQWTTNQITLANTASLTWGNSAPFTTPSFYLVRDSTGGLGLRNGNNQQGFYIYSAYTDSANYERLQINAGAGYTILQEIAGTGVARPVTIGTRGASNLSFRTNNTDRWNVSQAGYFYPTVDNTAATDIGDATHHVRNLYVGTQIIAPDGSVTVPSVGYASETGLGWYRSAAGILALAQGGVMQARIASGGFVWVGTGGIIFGANAGAQDAAFVREAANTLAQRNSTNAQIQFLYMTYTDASNYERLRIATNANSYTITNEAAGTGVTTRPMTIGPAGNATMNFTTNGVASWAIDGSGQFISKTDGAKSIGYTSQQRPSALYLLGGPIQLYNSAAGIANDGTNYERLTISYSNVIRIQQEAAGTGSTARDIEIMAARNLYFYTSGAYRWAVNNGGLFYPYTDNANDIGDATHRVKSLYVGTQLLAADGLNTAPSWSFANDPNTGVFSAAADHMGFSANGIERIRIGSTTGFQIKTDHAISWASGAMGSTNDLSILRDAANILAQRNSTNAQEQRIYGTFTDVSNYERLTFRTVAGDYKITPEALGTGTLRGLQIGASGGKLGFFGTTATVQASSAALTNSVTSGGSSDVISNFSDLVIYANDALTIRNDIYQLASKISQLTNILRTYGLAA